uniref:t-SNARE coiled-coil homology domain-containing protein n=1 Tax=Gadus morhua TaxID=8049 RepID=A0A8C5C180_GADMO
MRDRTKELGNAECSDEDEEGTALVVKPGTSTANEEKENDAYFKKVLEIREGLVSIKDKVGKLENKQKTVLGEPLPDESLKRDIQTLREEIKNIASQIQKKLKSEWRNKLACIAITHKKPFFINLVFRLAAIEPKKGEDDGKYVAINLRMQRTQHGVLSREFVELMGHCNTIQADYRDRNLERIKRQFKITGTDVTDDQLEDMIASGQTDVFTQNILSDVKATKQALNEIETRCEEILKLEKSIRDLHDMFQYLAMEVEAQGETVNRIESNILQSSNYVEKARDDVEKAVTYQKKARKKKIWLAVCCAILLLIVIISLAASLGG